jgi:hypothetical protein
VRAIATRADARNAAAPTGRRKNPRRENLIGGLSPETMMIVPCARRINSRVDQFQVEYLAEYEL